MLSHLLLPLAAAPSLIPALSIDKFTSADTNALGSRHGNNLYLQRRVACDQSVGYGLQFLHAVGRQDPTPLASHHLHVRLTGSVDSTAALRQNNPTRGETKAPYPETWDVAYPAGDA
ncbi:hypothetical protein FN846DRAFT_911324 [Sphaerosporella brunnea]|uniref:Intradiol ring-cleavage dioxygenases domain-containing protein n=1 Tax=Sphaerosporella brunnea TaxID=1250544 RepID=A0A5J5EJE4_9PEZI|nr:hypothetical protein FN846DRAFT_911324 [Sphaerosporella brunnea]